MPRASRISGSLRLCSSFRGRLGSFHGARPVPCVHARQSRTPSADRMAAFATRKSTNADPCATAGGGGRGGEEVVDGIGVIVGVGGVVGGGGGDGGHGGGADGDAGAGGEGGAGGTAGGGEGSQR